MRSFFILILSVLFPTVSLSENLKCPDSSQSSFLRLTPELLEKMKGEPKSFEVRRVEADWCIGDKSLRPFAVIQRRVKGEKFYFTPIFFDKFELKSPNVLSVSIRQYEWLGMSLAPVCGSDCQGVHSKPLGSAALPPHRLVVKVWDPETAKELSAGPVPVPEGVFFQDWQKTPLVQPKKANQVLAPILLMGSNQFSLPAVRAIREINKRGEGPVIWLHRGPFKEPYIPEASQAVDPKLSLEKVLKEIAEGAKLYFTGTAAELEQFTCPKLEALKIQPLLAEASVKKEIRPVRWTSTSADLLKSQTHPQTEVLPTVRTRPVYVLGWGHDDPRPAAINSRMTELGWKEVKILPGGLSQLFFSVCEASDIRDLYAR